jgi:hypothetical protein
MTKQTRIKRSIRAGEALFCQSLNAYIFKSVKFTNKAGYSDVAEIEPQGLGQFVGYLMRSEIPYRFEESRREGHLRLDFDVKETESIGSITFPSPMSIGDLLQLLEQVPAIDKEFASLVDS